MLKPINSGVVITRTDEAVGSIPICSTMNIKGLAEIAKPFLFGEGIRLPFFGSTLI